MTLTIATNKYINKQDISYLSVSDIEALLTAGKLMTPAALQLAVDMLDFELMDIRYYPADNAWGW